MLSQLLGGVSLPLASHQKTISIGNESLNITRRCHYNSHSDIVQYGGKQTSNTARTTLNPYVYNLNFFSL